MATPERRAIIISSLTLPAAVGFVRAHPWLSDGLPGSILKRFLLQSHLPRRPFASGTVKYTPQGGGLTTDIEKEAPVAEGRPVSLQLGLGHPAYMVWGANTGVGKTLVSAGIVVAALREGRSAYAAGGATVGYLKPVQTGWPADSDADFVARKAGLAAALVQESETGSELEIASLLATPGLISRTIWAFSPPVSPHVAARGLPLSDGRVVRETLAEIQQLLRAIGTRTERQGSAAARAEEGESGVPAVGVGRAAGAWPAFGRWDAGVGGRQKEIGTDREQATGTESGRRHVTGTGSGGQQETGTGNAEQHKLGGGRGGLVLVETAGGVASPGPSGSLQCDLYRPLRLPALLVGDGRLGGISTTLAAAESLSLRGYDVAAVALMDHGLGNAEAIQKHLGEQVPVFSLPPLPDQLLPRQSWGPQSSLSSQASLDPLTWTTSNFSTSAYPWANSSSHATPGAEAALSSATGPRALDLCDSEYERVAVWWLAQCRAPFQAMLVELLRAHEERVAVLQAMGTRAREVLWWPFTQHGLVGPGEVTVIDSRCGENFAVYEPQDRDKQQCSGESNVASLGDEEPSLGGRPTILGIAREPVSGGSRELSLGSAGEENLGGPQTWSGGSDQLQGNRKQAGSLAAQGTGAGWENEAVAGRDNEAVAGRENEVAGRLVTQFDACASWWTQGVDQASQPQITKAVAYAAGRFGHVMFPENVHTPALQLAESLLQGVGANWASRVFYSDNGSTAVEVAIKMAFRKYVADHGLTGGSGEGLELRVIGLEGSYHGDTLGAMEAQAPTPYTSFMQQPWHTGRGLFLPPATVACRNGCWTIDPPPDLGHGPIQAASRDAVFDLEARRHGPLADAYREFLSAQLSHTGEKTRLGALIIEPVIHGAGGMVLIDPLYQRLLVEECRRRLIPVIYDEVFAGIYRLGVESTVQLLGCMPDVACYAKLLTGGVVPLAATLATEAVFSAFYGDAKLHALLHGHSYTAHAIGCSAGVKALSIYRSPDSNRNLQPGSPPRLREFWDLSEVAAMSRMGCVSRAFALGTICAVELTPYGAGATQNYGSLASAGLIRRLRSRDIYARPLGNVVYLMCTPLTNPVSCREMLTSLREELEREQKLRR